MCQVLHSTDTLYNDGAATGYTLHLRQLDDRPDSAAIVRQFISIVNHRNGPPPEAASTGERMSQASCA